MAGYQVSFTEYQGRLLRDDPAELASFSAIANLDMVDDVRNIAKVIAESDVVVEPGTGRGKTEMFTFENGLFEWRPTPSMNVVEVSACEGSDSITGLKVTFASAGEDDEVETRQLGSREGLTCSSQRIDEGECFTYASVAGNEVVSRLAFETAAGKTIIVGSDSPATNHWSTLNTDQRCLTGIFGVYRSGDGDFQSLQSIGFFFGDFVEEAPAKNSNLAVILLAIMAFGGLSCSALLLFMCRRQEMPVEDNASSRTDQEKAGPIKLGADKGSLISLGKQSCHDLNSMSSGYAMEKSQELIDIMPHPTGN
jgi:hypothetical protein